VEGFKYLGTTLTNQNSILEEMEKGLKSSNRSRIFVHHRLVSVVKRVEAVSDRMFYIQF
jgi:hypothetical protein